MNAFHKKSGWFRDRLINFSATVVMIVSIAAGAPLALATTKGLNQIVTPDLQPEGDLSTSFQLQDQKIGNPYQLQAELGLTQWAEVAVFKGFQPNELIFSSELGLVTKEPICSP